ncbi:MAG: hypothetical protein QW514_09710 [Thermoprotei archaeon]
MASRLPEKRLRLRKKMDIAPTVARMNSKVVQELQIKDKIEIVIAGKRRLELSVVPIDDIPPNEVHCNESTLTRSGIADNSIATIRALQEVNTD